MSNMLSYAQGLRGRYVRLERGPEAKQGWLLGVRTDYMSLWTDDGDTVHLLTHHIKRMAGSLTVRSYDQSQKNADGTSPLDAALAAFDEMPETFADLLASMRGQLVRLYPGGPEAVKGVVHEVGDDHVLVLTGLDEITCLPIYHLRGISRVLGNEEKSEGGGQQDGKDGNKDGGKDDKSSSKDDKNGKDDKNNKNGKDDKNRDKKH
ncbi:MAG TPA: hypothetical protein VFK80_11785 [Limnochordia bacterium]|nr:hypothetical protein [Limnochordia bacterium]